MSLRNKQSSNIKKIETVLLEKFMKIYNKNSLNSKKGNYAFSKQRNNKNIKKIKCVIIEVETQIFFYSMIVDTMLLYIYNTMIYNN